MTEDEEQHKTLTGLTNKEHRKLIINLAKSLTACLKELRKPLSFEEVIK